MNIAYVPLLYGVGKRENGHHLKNGQQLSLPKAFSGGRAVNIVRTEDLECQKDNGID
jgi:hypothetical protein